MVHKQNLLRLELIMMGDLNASEDYMWAYRLLHQPLLDSCGSLPYTSVHSMYPDEETSFIMWIIEASSIYYSTKKEQDERFTHLLSKLPEVCFATDTRGLLPEQVSSDIWLIPFTTENVNYLVVKTIGHLLINYVLFDGPSNMRYLDAACIVAILSQIDTLTYSCEAFRDRASLPILSTMDILQTNWTSVREAVLKYLRYPSGCVEDSGLLHQFLRMESTLDKDYVSQSDRTVFLDACVQCMKAVHSKPIGQRLMQFVVDETPTILTCLSRKQHII